MLQRRCVFCQLDPKKVVLENDGAKAFFDIHPMSKGHLLVVPKQHYRTWFDIPTGTQFQIVELLNDAKQMLD